MQPLAILKCIAKAALRVGGRYLGVAALPGDIAEEVWKEWNKERDEAARRAELQVLVHMAAQDFRRQVEEVVGAVAGGQPADVRGRLSACLEQIPDLAKKAFAGPREKGSRDAKPNWTPRQASDLLPLLSFSHEQLPGNPPTELDNEPPPAAQARVLVTYTKGPWKGREETYSDHTLLLFGRSKNCTVRFPKDEHHDKVSCHHCLLEINPPDVRLRDLGSTHGTLLDGQLIGKRPKGTTPKPDFESSEHDLADGNEVQLTKNGQVAFRVNIIVPPRCSQCGSAIADDLKASCAQPSGGYQCPACRRDADRQPEVRKCTWCHRDVTASPGANRPGMFVCPDCRDNMQSIMKGMFSQAKKGDAELRVIRDYTLKDELGHGGMGAVYLALHGQTNRPVAIKLMLPKVATDEHAVSLFQREIRNCKALNHPHLVRLLDDGYAKGGFFMILEYCDSGSVSDLMKKRGKLSVDEAGEIILQALTGLEHAHNADIPFVKQKGGGFKSGKGLVHRDLKPANLFLTGQGSGRITKIGDFGLAKAFEETGLTGGTRTGHVAGTWHFMCRRQVAHYKSAGPEVDVWAMAASLYNMLTGRLTRDFPDPKAKSPWMAILETDSVPILTRNPKIPPKLAQLIDHALDERKELAFPTAAAFHRELENVL